MTSDDRRPGVFAWQAAFRVAPKVDGLSATAVAVGYALATYATYATGESARPSQATLATASGAHIRTVGRALEALELAGWVEVTAEATPATPKTYRLAVPRPGVVPTQARPGAGSEADEGPVSRRVGPGMTPTQARPGAGSGPASRRTTCVETYAGTSSRHTEGPTSSAWRPPEPKASTEPKPERARSRYASS